MSRRAKRSRKVPVIRRGLPAGTAPGTIAVDPDAPKPRITVMGYGPEGFEEHELADVAEIKAHRGRWPVLWVGVEGLGDKETLQHIGAEFDLHRLTLEDVINVSQRAKSESYEKHLFLVVRMIRLAGQPETEQVSMLVGDGYLLTFREAADDRFEPVRDRIRRGHGRLRRAGPDYLAYALIDTVIDGYYPVFEAYGDRLEAMDEEVASDPDGDLGGRIHVVKRELLVIRRALAPHRDLLASLLRGDSEFITEGTMLYLRDCQDHVFQLLELMDTYRDLAAGLRDVYLNILSARMNEVMKVLTIFAAIFIPLNFLAALYGMNFAGDSPWNMPELQWRYGYPVALLTMAVVAGGLFVYFRKRGWIGAAGRSRRDADRE